MSDYSFSEHEIEAAFYDFVASLGYEPDYKGWKSDGERRTARLKSSADKGRESSAKARLYVDKPANGWIYDYRRDEYIRWNYRETIQGDRARLDAYQAELPTPEEQAAKKAAREKYEEWERTEPVRKAREKFALAQPFNGTHEYLVCKGVQAHEGLRRDVHGNLVIPMYKLPDMKNIVNYQRIAPDGGKYFAPDCSVDGAVYIIEATGIPIAVCFNCHNLTKAAANINAHLKASDYFIFADNDRGNEARADLRKNHGMEAAREAARALGVDAAHIIAPEAPEGENVDWNDREALLSCEPDALRREIERKIYKAGLKPKEREYVTELERLKPITEERLREIRENRGCGLDIGWTTYNARGEGMPLKLQGLTLLAARTSGGKTLSLSNIAARVMTRDPEAHILFISLEEAEESAYYRVLSSFMAQTDGASSPTKREIETALEMGGERWAQYSQERRDKWASITAAMNYLAEHLLIADLMTVSDLDNVEKAAGLISAFYDQYKEHAVICLDYIQILKPPKQGAGDYRDFKQVMYVLRKLIARKVNIIAAAQLNRDPARGAANDPVKEFKDAYCEQLREAADIEQALVFGAHGPVEVLVVVR